MLLARSRYLFIAMHRARFADHILAELRGIIDEAGGSPFWDGLAGRFFGMNFQDADQFNAIHGNQFIADLMPKHPIYIAMLTDTARAANGMPPPSGRAATRMRSEARRVGNECVGKCQFRGSPAQYKHKSSTAVNE